jgi:hypothetical protein
MSQPGCFWWGLDESSKYQLQSISDSAIQGNCTLRTLQIVNGVRALILTIADG